MIADRPRTATVIHNLDAYTNFRIMQANGMTLKPLKFLGSSLDDLRAMPKAVQTPSAWN